MTGQFLTHTNQPIMRARSAHEIALELLRRQGLQFVQAIDPTAGLFQHFGIDVAGKHFPATRRRAQRISQRNGDTVRLFAGRCRSAPDPIFAAVTTCTFRQHREMVPFAEEGRQVGGQRVDKSLPLCAALICFQHAEVVAKIIQPQRTQSTNQAVINHIPLVVRQHDPRALVD